jgi:Tn3 transposase DDE domain
MLSLHLLQVSLVYINTLMIQQVLAEPAWQGRLVAADLRALTPLLWAHVNPYGTFTLNMRGMFGIRVKTGHKPLLKMCVQEKQPVAWWSKLACTHHMPRYVRKQVSENAPAQW